MSPQSCFSALVILATLLSVEPAIAQQQGPPPAPPVTVAPPLAKRIATWDEYSGRFEAIEAVEVRPRVSGFIEKIHFKDGQLVKAGDQLFTIDPREYRIAVESAEAEIARSDAQVDLAENEVERARPLVKTGAVTERDFDQRSANLNVQRAALQAAQASLKRAQLNLEWTAVTAPVSGRISDRKVDIGNLVTGGTGGTTLLTTIVSLEPIHFVFDASEADYLRYGRLSLAGGRKSSRDTDNPVRVRLADEAEFKHTGHMDFVDNQLNARSGTIRGRAIFDNKDQLFVPGVFARMQLFGGDLDALLIPDGAVVSDQMRKIVFVVGDDNVVKAAPVTLGPLEEGLRVITKGLAKDDKVVIEGIANPMVRPGAKVTPKPGEIKAAEAPPPPPSQQ
ncbi:MAG: efflux RND transporter periplasmic adaptor subunit [Hyphomicrobiaceae bacterium]|nr:efflux RND transporter periplasmic adaptor subunit [Hyphomicrobiaceae bacterium]